MVSKVKSSSIAGKLLFSKHWTSQHTVPLCSTKSLQIESDSFSYLSKLKYLDLSNNNIKSLPLKLPQNIRVLSFIATLLGNLHTSDFQNLLFLETILLGNNCNEAALSELCNNNFSIENLTFSSKTFSHLGIPYNNLTEVPHWLLSPSLLGLNLQGNPIHLIRSNDFQTCPNLTRLTLSWTSKFDKIPLTIMKGAFDNLNKLVVLELAGNMLKQLPNFSLHHKPHLLGLGLAFNCLKMSVHDPSNISTAPLIGLQLNGNTFCDNKIYPSKTRIHKLRLRDAFSKMTELISLDYGAFTAISLPLQAMFWDLSYGYQYDIVDEESIRVLKDLSKLRKLSLALNGIRFVDMSAFCLLNLTFLDLGINQIERLSFETSQPLRMKRNIENRFDERMLTMLMHHHKHYLSDTSKHSFLLLHRNAITRIPIDAFKCFTTISYLDLSYNQINYINNYTFMHMKQLEVLDLQFNPIRRIHPDSTKSLAKLSTLSLNYTTFQKDFTLRFLTNLSSGITLHYGDITDNIYRLLAAYRKNASHFSEVVAIHFTGIPIPIYDVANNAPIFSPFPNLQQIILTKAQLTTTLGDHFFGGVNKVTNVISHNCQLRNYPYKALKQLKQLMHLDLSQNDIEVLNRSWFNSSQTLISLDLSYNFIGYIEPGTFEILVKSGLKDLDLSHNYISDVSHSIIGIAVLKNLRYLDLRKNMLSCDCSLKDNFGWLIYSNDTKLVLSGFLSKCPAVVENYYGGCLRCFTVTSSHSQSLFMHSLINTCEVDFLIILIVCFTMFTLSFQILSITFNSKSFKNWFIKLWSRNTLLQNFQNNDDNLQPKIYAYDGFVFFDKNDSTIGDWVDNMLVPNLKNGYPSFRIGVAGKEEWCGDTQVKQLLLKMEASRKTIVLLAESYAQSSQCKYVLSVLEEYVHSNSENRSIVITFSQRALAGRAFQMRRRRCQWSVLNHPDPSLDDVLFWELLRNAIASKQRSVFQQILICIYEFDFTFSFWSESRLKLMLFVRVIHHVGPTLPNQESWKIMNMFKYV